MLAGNLPLVAARERDRLALNASSLWIPFLYAMKVMVHTQSASRVSGQELGKRKGAMATRRHQIVLPGGREQDRVDAGVGGGRGAGGGWIRKRAVRSRPN